MIYVRMPSGKSMPCNEHPDTEGNVTAERDVAGVWVGHVLKKDEQPHAGQRRYMPHFATCPHVKAEEERKKATAPTQRAPRPEELQGNVAILTPKRFRAK